MRKLSIATLVLLALVGLGFAGVSQQRVTLSLWDQFTEEAPSQGFEKIITAFEVQYPNIQIQRTPMTGDDIEKLLPLNLQSGKGPDIVYAEVGGRIVDIARAGFLYDLTDIYSHYRWDNKIPDFVEQYVTIDGKVWGVPMEVELDHVIYYWKSIFTRYGLEPPKTFSEFTALCDTLMSKGIKPLAIGDRVGAVSLRFFNNFAAFTCGSDVLNNVLFGEDSWDQPCFKKAATLTVDFINKYEAQPSALSRRDARVLFSMKKAAMLPSGTWDIKRFFGEAKNPEDIDFFLIPPVSGKGGAYPAIGVGSAFYINAALKNNPPRLDAALKFLNFILSDAALKIWLEDVRILPGAKVDISQVKLEPILKKTYKTIVNSPKVYPNFQAIFPPDTLNETRQVLMSQFRDGKITVDQFLQRLDALWKEARGRVVKP